MVPTLLISVREFLEAFLIVGVFLGISRKLELKREKEIYAAAGIGIILSVLMSVVVFSLGKSAGAIFTEKNADLLEGYLMVFSGFFLAYVVFSLHDFFVLRRSKLLIQAHQKMQQNIFDISLFLTIVFFVVREGFEIALFTATTSLFSTFMENMAGLISGLAISSILGLLTFFAYLKFPIGKVFKYTEYMIILLGAAFVKNGLHELFEVHLGIHLDHILPIRLAFLPSTDTVVGKFIQTMTGLQPGFSLAYLAIMATYCGVIYFVFLRKHYPQASHSA